LSVGVRTALVAWRGRCQTQSAECDAAKEACVNIDRLAKEISDKAGITLEQARTALTATIEDFKRRLPEPVFKEIQALFEATDEDEDRARKGALAAQAATTAAINVVVLPHAR